MSASPQPPPPAVPAHREEPVAQSNGSPPASSSPAQLAALLTKSLQEAESLKSELAQVKRRADKAERLLAVFQQSSQSTSPNGSPPGSSQGAPSKPHLSEAARKAIFDSDARADAAERARDEAEARLRMLQEYWTDVDRFFSQMDARTADMRSRWTRYIESGGGPIVPIGNIPSQNASVYLPTALQQHDLPLPPLPHRSHSVRTRLAGPSQPFPSVTLPPPPSTSSSRVRPRADSMDAGYNNGVLSGPGAPPPAKRPRAERDSDRGREHRYSLSVSPNSDVAVVRCGLSPPL